MLQTIERRSSRISKEVPIQIFGTDALGKVFMEQTKTVLLSRHGAGIVSRYQFKPEQEMVVRRMDTNAETEIRIVGQIGAESEIYTYGAAFQDADINFWDTDFPSPSFTEADKAGPYCTLECATCKARETVNGRDITWDVNRINDGIVRNCRRCKASTIWKWTTEEADVAEPAPAPATSATPAPRAKAPAVQNRRKRVRAKVSYNACIRSGPREDIAVCEDMSRGGLRFVSSKRYPKESKIEVAVPYSPGAPGIIFVRAEIVYALELPEKGLFRYGAQYIKYS